MVCCSCRPSQGRNIQGGRSEERLREQEDSLYSLQNRINYGYSEQSLKELKVPCGGTKGNSTRHFTIENKIVQNVQNWEAISKDSNYSQPTPKSLPGFFILNWNLLLTSAFQSAMQKSLSVWYLHRLWVHELLHNVKWPHKILLFCYKAMMEIHEDLLPTCHVSYAKHLDQWLEWLEGLKINDWRG